MNRGWIIEKLGMWYQKPTTQKISRRMHWDCIFKKTPAAYGGSKLFPDLSHYNRHMKVLVDIIKYLKEDISSYDMVEKLGSHLVKKGAATFVC